MLPLKKYKGKGLFKKTNEERIIMKEKEEAKVKERKTKHIVRLKNKLEELQKELASKQIQQQAPPINFQVQPTLPFSNIQPVENEQYFEPSRQNDSILPE